MNFNSRVYEIVRQIPEGKVASYGQVACMAGSLRASRAVGYALHRNPFQQKVPCHRVVLKMVVLQIVLDLVVKYFSDNCSKEKALSLLLMAA